MEQNIIQKIDAICKILEEEREFSPLNLLGMRSVNDFKKQYLMNVHGDLFLTVDSLIRLNNIVTGCQYMDLRTCDVKSTGVSKWYMSVNKIEPALYGLVDHFNDRKITPRQFCLVSLDEIHPFVGGNGRTCKVLFADKIENFSYLFGDYIFFRNLFFNKNGTYQNKNEQL